MLTTPFFSNVAAILAFGLTLATGACAAPAFDNDNGDAGFDRAETLGTATSAQRVNPPPVGGACSVVSGANSGKSGTYNADGDCAGSWGMSECKNQDGTDSGKCKSAKIVVWQPPIYVPSGGVVAH